MLNFSLFVVLFASCEGFNPSRRGEFVSRPDSPDSDHLVEGDIVVPESHLVGGEVQAAFVTDGAALWPKGFIPYRIETEDFGNGPEPIFTDPQIENITQSLQQICTDVPCIQFE